MRKLLLALMLLILIPSILGATGSQGTESPFSFGAGAREIALGSASIARPTPAMAPYWNPAYLARAQHLSILLFHSQLYESDVAYQYAGLVFPTLDYGTFGVGLFRLGVDGIELRDDNNFFLGETSESRLALYLAYGKSVSGFDLGLSLHMEQQNLAELKATSSPALNLSLSRGIASGIPWMPEVTAVLSGRNLVGEKLRLDEQNIDHPVSLDAAFSSKLLFSEDQNNTVDLSVRAAKVDKVDPILCAGIEYGLYNTLFLRAGVRDSRYSFGTGLRIRNFQFDYSLTDRDLGSLHLFNLSFDIGASRSDRLLARKEREANRFNELMRARLSAESQAVIDSLVGSGETMMQEEEYDQAKLLFDRALFLARSSGGDTTTVAHLAQHSAALVAELTDKRQFEAMLDSARTRLEGGDLIGARYFASQATTIRPDDTDALQLQHKIDEQLIETENTQKLINAQLDLADSLLAFGNAAAAIEQLEPVKQIPEHDSRVDRLLARAHFEQWKQRAQIALVKRDYRYAAIAVDSAGVYYPNHPWCKEFRSEITAARRKNADLATTKPTVQQPMAQRAPLSDAVRTEVEEKFKDGKRRFEAGKLEDAIQTWEYVERLAPDFEGVRNYLTRAYKFVGVKLYGQDKLTEALDAWRRAMELNPNDAELRDYIDRTERELTNLRELTYGNQ